MKGNVVGASCPAEVIVSPRLPASKPAVAGNEYPDRVYEVASASKMDEQTAAISRHLCGYTTPAHGVTPTDAAFHHTTKRDVQAMRSVLPLRAPEA